MPRRHRRFRFLRRALLALGLLLLALPAGALGLVWWTLPPRTASVALPGLGAPVAVVFDEAGVPRIAAADARDAARALGYLHARDRLPQMDALRRAAEGRTAELAGPAALRLDRFSRLLGLRPRAEADLAALDAPTRELLEAYAAGVNAWIAERGRFAAPEFLVLGAPEPWQPVHSLLWGKLMGLWLSGNWRAELARLELAERLPPERVWDIWPRDGSAGRPDFAAWPGAGRILAQVPVFGVDAPLPASASNAWAVAGARSASGAPLLANDPHLGYSAPILWYVARIELGDGGLLAGATAPGVPAVLIGRSRDLAWGFTTTHSDTQDLFIEPESAARVVRTEVIRVRGQPDVSLTVRETANGPVVSDLDDGPRPEGRVLSLRMASLEPGDTAASGLLALGRARDLAEARAAAERITSPQQNLIVATRQGDIAMLLTGRTPRRAAGDGALPSEGPGWLGFLGFEELPHVENPASGVVASANNRAAPEGHPAFLGRDWFGDWRFRRIHELVAARPHHDALSFAALQMDAVSLLARDSLPLLNALPRREGVVGAAQALLAGWDGAMDAGRPEPLIWAGFSQRMRALALASRGVPGAPAGPEFLRFLLSDPRAAWWCEEDCAALAARALASAVEELAARFGADPRSWRWGVAHAARFEHPLLRAVPGLGELLRLEVQVSGDGETLQRQAMGGLAGGELSALRFGARHGAGLRLVADLADPDATLVVIATGQSGHPLSRHWGDQIGAWQAGQPRRLNGTPARVTGRLTLTP